MSNNTANQSIITPKHIAFISNGEGMNAPLDYKIESSQRLNAQIDLLIQAAADLDKIAAVKKVIDYVVKQSSLIFIIATPVDTVAKTLLEEVSPKDNNRIHVPFVLIKDEIVTSTLEQTAA